MTDTAKRMVAEYARAFWGKSEEDQAGFAQARAKRVKNRKKQLAKRAKSKAAKGKGMSKGGGTADSAPPTGRGKGKDKVSTPSRTTGSDGGRDTDENTSEEEVECIQDAVDEGRKAWEKWAAEQFVKWDLNKVVDKVLTDESKDPRLIMRKLKTKEVRSSWLSIGTN